MGRLPGHHSCDIISVARWLPRPVARHRHGQLAARRAGAATTGVQRMGVTVEGPFLRRSSVCEPVLRSLPQWFGIKEAADQYIQDIEGLPTLLARDGDSIVGFLTLVVHSAYSAEIHVMGVRPEYHRRGVGAALVRAAERNLRQRGVEYLQVKTLSPQRKDKNYAHTRQFYYALGFRPLEEFPELWGPENPCLQMIKGL